MLEDPKRFGLDLSASQRRAIKKMVGAEQYLALYDQFCIKGFVERQKQDLEQRKALGGKHHDEKRKELEYNAAAAKYMCDRFKWSRVDDARLDDLIDNAQAYELELAETELAAFRSLKGDAKTRAVYKALQTQAFLQRNEADIRKREVNQQMGWVSVPCMSPFASTLAGLPAREWRGSVVLLMCGGKVRLAGSPPAPDVGFIFFHVLSRVRAGTFDAGSGSSSRAQQGQRGRLPTTVPRRPSIKR